MSDVEAKPDVSKKFRETVSYLKPELLSSSNDMQTNLDPNILDNFEHFYLGVQNQKIQMPLTFERVPSSEVGTRSSRWRKAVVASLVGSGMTALSKAKNDEEHQQQQQQSRPTMSASTIIGGQSNYEGGQEGPPFYWDLSQSARKQLSLLSVQLLLHEVACYTCIFLLGCLAIEGISLHTHSPDNINFLLEAKHSLITGLVVISSLGFLMRIDSGTAEGVLYGLGELIPLLCAVSCHYVTKAWERQEQECVNLLSSEKSLKGSKVHFTQDCHGSYNQTIVFFKEISKMNSLATNPELTHVAHSELTASVFVLRLVPIIVFAAVSLHLFLSRGKLQLFRKLDY